MKTRVKLVSSLIILLGTLAAGVAGLSKNFAAPPVANQWSIGPIIRGKNYSVGMPTATRAVRGGWTFSFPQPNVEAGHVHYVSRRHASLAGKKQIVLRFRVDAAPSVRFVPQERPELQGMVSLSFQRMGDNWSGTGRRAYYRWYAPGSTLRALAPGTFDMTIPLDDPQWVSVNGQMSGDNQAAFQDAKANTESISLVFGSIAARGHGIYATGRARFTLLDFRVD